MERETDICLAIQFHTSFLVKLNVKSVTLALFWRADFKAAVLI
jgi:hypothetical protein